MATRKKSVVRWQSRGGTAATAIRRTRSTTTGAVRPGVSAAHATAVLTRAGRQRAEQLVRTVARLRTDVAKSFYRMGVALRDLSQPAAYRALGYDTFADLLEQRAITSRMTANKLIAIVDAFDEAVAQRLGVEKSYAFLRYAKIAQPRADAAKLVQKDPVIPGTQARLSAISVRDLRLAARTLRERTLPATEPDAATRRAVRALGRVLRRAGVDTSKVRSRRKGDQWLVRIELDAEEVAELVRLVEG